MKNYIDSPPLRTIFLSLFPHGAALARRRRRRQGCGARCPWFASHGDREAAEFELIDVLMQRHVLPAIKRGYEAAKAAENA